jgi:hypothetical protein
MLHVVHFALPSYKQPGSIKGKDLLKTYGARSGQSGLTVETKKLFSQVITEMTFENVKKIYKVNMKIQIGNYP